MGKVSRSIAVVAAVTASSAGCTMDISDGLPAVTTENLQSDITERFAEAGERPQSVSCKDPLVGEVGQTARCDVVMSPTNSFEPIVTVTSVDGATINYELVPALSKEQLERAVVRLVDDAGTRPDSQATCLDGLIGAMGEAAQCDVTTAGVTLRRTAEVTRVDGLMMNFDLVPILTKAEVEDSLLTDLSRHLGRRPDSATCAGDLQGKPGNTVDCTVIAGPEAAAFTVTVTTVDGTKIDFSYAPRS
ncbi:DUF4333 domain-containing protein [Mycobacterium sp. 236(2023)]|uniref:DUF4333 domain-containing protein n=1 Tax=Mycobacterium sp. 236(2023) TaxID=3038163 RepID=UPI00241554C6|nr:DUF4333 domain-containing protein [Mycobacterium sp. 236(2023)]MDG4666618.1 DUF4333 domain-containing protein [Mycobacterium sp. 236(2023)]